MKVKVDGLTKIHGEKRGSVEAMKVNGQVFVLEPSTFIRTSVFYLSECLFLVILSGQFYHTPYGPFTFVHDILPWTEFILDGPT